MMAECWQVSGTHVTIKLSIDCESLLRTEFNGTMLTESLIIVIKKKGFSWQFGT